MQKTLAPQGFSDRLLSMEIEMTEQERELHNYIKNVINRGEDYGLVNDPKFWAEYGIYTIDQLTHHLLLEHYVDLYKEIHGFKPRFMLSELRAMSIDQLNEAIDNLR